MTKHEMHLHNDPFNKIKNGTKTIEIRLNDEKRRLIQVNDNIVFTNRFNGEEITAKVVNLHHYENFASLYQDFDKISLGYNIEDEAQPKDMEMYYSKEEQEKYGVVGIEVQVIIE